MLGTFLTLVILPERSFQGGNPLLLGVLGEFVVKNLVLIAAGLVVGASIRHKSIQCKGCGSHASFLSSDGSGRYVPVVHQHHRRSGHSP
jgi:hypothetical protein